MKKNGYSVVELVVVLGIFSIFYFSMVGIVSSKIDVKFEEEMFNNKISTIEKQAEIYAKNSEKLFESSNSVYMTVKDLAQLNVIITNKEGVVVDPRNDNNDLNNLKVKITNENNEISAKVLI